MKRGRAPAIDAASSPSIKSPDCAKLLSQTTLH